MKRFIEGEDRTQITLLPECLDDFVAEDNPVRVVEVFVDEVDVGGLGFEGIDPPRLLVDRPGVASSICLAIHRCHRRQQVQGGEQPRPQLHRRQDQARPAPARKALHRRWISLQQL